MKKCLLLACALGAVALIGCVNPPVVPVKPSVEYVVIKPKKEDMVDAFIAKPPIAEEYAAIKDESEREGVLIEWGQQLLRSLIDVNNRLDAIRKTVELGETVYRGEQSK